MDDASGRPARRDSAALLGAALARKFHEHNYTIQYLARRCRTEIEVVESWRDGVTVPNFRDWWYLLRVHRSFDLLTSLWKAAAGEVGLAVEDPDFVGDRRQRETPAPRPVPRPAGAPGDPIEPMTRVVQTTRVIEIRAPEEVDLPGLPPPATTPEERPGPSLSPSPSMVAAQSTPAPASSPPSTGSSGEPAIRVPDGFVVYRCRITRGRILEISLPVDLTSADVERICAFLRTQTDDEEGRSS